jgi:predicted  nucleic acid-binding Zn-ribbon protein
MVIAENEPKYCPYCGVRFVRVTTSEGEQREILGE